MDQKVVEINLESGSPAVDQAIVNMVNQLTTQMRRGCKAVILIHGYGSSGIGGSIRTAVRNKLSDGSLQGVVRASVAGENWMNRRKEFLGFCGSLVKYDRRIDGNEGITVVLLR
jgi:hypothetical protein